MSTKKIKSEHSPDGWQIIESADFDPNQHEEFVEPDEAAEAESKAKADDTVDDTAKKAKADEKAAAEAAEKERLAEEAEDKKAAGAAGGEGKSDAPVATRKKVS